MDTEDGEGGTGQHSCTHSFYLLVRILIFCPDYGCGLGAMGMPHGIIEQKQILEQRSDLVFIMS